MAMFIENKTTLIRREIMTLVAQFYFEDRVSKAIDTIPLQIIPRDAHPIRCCIYKDREIIRLRTIATLGFSLEQEAQSETLLLSDFANIALGRSRPEFPILTFISEACKACVRANYMVTNMCHNCVTQPCMAGCPKGAIKRIGEQAQIDPSMCINCGICLKACPFHAIVYVPVPCEEACPVKAISKDEQGKEVIDYSKCIFCGRCARACPFGAIMDKSQIVDVLAHMQRGRSVAAMIAPSIMGQFKASMPQLVYALRALGFTHVVEVALGADQTAAVESAEFIERIKRGDKVMGTSCCPAYVEAVRKHSTAFLPYVSVAKTPMAYTAELVKAAYPDAVRVFIGPCIAKKHEGLSNPDIDYVLMYSELAALFAGKGLKIEECPADAVTDLGQATAIGRGFPVQGGVADAIITGVKGKVDIKPVFIDGLTRQNVKLLNAYAKKCPGNLVEVMSCEGGCVNGPGVIREPQAAAGLIAEFIIHAAEHLDEK
jgi:[FeFe] hydrogenase (group B1/B3)